MRNKVYKPINQNYIIPFSLKLFRHFAMFLYAESVWCPLRVNVKFHCCIKILCRHKSFMYKCFHRYIYVILWYTDITLVFCTEVTFKSCIFPPYSIKMKQVIKNHLKKNHLIKNSNDKNVLTFAVEEFLSFTCNLHYRLSIVCS